MVTRLDYQVGRVLDALAASGQAKNTIVVFTSDNGGERFSGTWPFSGRKTELLEGGLRIPAIVRWPGVTRAGSTSDAHVISMDWLPTFLAAAGTAPDPARASDGIDIRPALRGGALPERMLFWRYKNHGQQAARRGKWKYLKIKDQSYLFDLDADGTRQSEGARTGGVQGASGGMGGMGRGDAAAGCEDLHPRDHGQEPGGSFRGGLNVRRCGPRGAI
jgi:arylsulfatase A-like enzyme